MTKTIVKRLTAFVLALVMCATAFMAAGGANVKAASDNEYLDGFVYPAGTVEKDAFRFSSGCQINFIAGNENLVPSKQELMNSFSADALYAYRYTYRPQDNTTLREKWDFMYILHNRLVPFTSDAGTVNFKPAVFEVGKLPQRNMPDDKFFATICANDNSECYWGCDTDYDGLTYFTKEMTSPFVDLRYKVVVSFYSPACYFEVIDTWTVPYSRWTDEAANAGQSCEEYFK